MIDDFVQPEPPRKKPKIIEPLENPEPTPPPELPAQEGPHSELSDQTATEETERAEPVQPATTESAPRPKKRRQWPYGRKQTIIMAVVAFVVLAGGSVASYAMTRPNVKGGVYQSKRGHYVPPKPTTVASTLTGLQVDPSANKRPVTGVMVENSLDARPQSGLSGAGVVFEAVAEGGVTRFLALFQDQTPDNVGPIRSARPYFIQWDMGFDAPYAHVGGSPDGLADIKAWGVKDLDQFYNAGSYHRISSRYAPHNVYTSIGTLNQLEARKGYTSSTFTGFARGKEAPSKQPDATHIGFSLSGPLYDPSYDYSAATNSYNRSENGQPQVDAGTGKQLSPKVVIAITVPLSRGVLDSSGAYYSDYNPIGSGTAYVFQNGTLVTGQWHKASSTANISFTDANGQPLLLNPGQTWITAVTDTGKISYR